MIFTSNNKHIILYFSKSGHQEFHIGELAIVVVVDP